MEYHLYVHNFYNNYVFYQLILVFQMIQLIDDIGLLEEIIQWNENLNVDRITAAMGCVSYAHYLRVSNLWRPLRYKVQDNSEQPQVKQEPPKKLNFFNKTQKKTFFRSR